jgi:GntR family transcriptional regulator
MYVAEGARKALLHSERERFLREEWPMLRERLERLGLDRQALLSQPKNGAAA